MKYLLLTLLSLHTLYANNVNNADAVTIHSSSVYLIMLFFSIGADDKLCLFYTQM